MTRIEELVRDTLIERAADAPPPAPVIQRALAGDSGRTRRRVVTLAAFGTAASIAAAVCVGQLVDGRTGSEGSEQPAATASATPEQQVAGDVRTVEIYAAAIERAMTEFVMSPDHPNPPTRVDVTGPVDAADRAAISEAVADVTSLQWVRQLLPLDVFLKRPVMRLRAIEETGDADRVEVHGYLVDVARGEPVNELHTHALAYVLEERDGTWRYAGPVSSGPPNPSCDGIPAGEPRC